MGCVDSRLNCLAALQQIAGSNPATTPGSPGWFDPGRWTVPPWTVRPADLSDVTDNIEGMDFRTATVLRVQLSHWGQVWPKKKLEKMGSGHSYYQPRPPPAYETNAPRDTLVVSPIDPDPNDDETLRVESVDLQIGLNTEQHHTDEYSVAEQGAALVVRRGDPFTISLTFNRPYNKTTDDLRLRFESDGRLKQEFVLSDKDRPGAWGAKLSKQQDRNIELKVFTPPECAVAKWSLMVDVLKKKDDRVRLFRHKHQQPIYILFNPWCKDDTVYVDGVAEREGYVLEDSGRIYNGSYKRISSKPWNFAQFEDKVLECSMLLLDKCRLRQEDRGDAVMVARRLSALVNVQNDSGVLVGNWSGNYEGGTRPLAWSGSQAILDQYYTTGKPVKFGQCWVFSGVLTSVCRSLGIPTRSVTNFSSAHDTDASITIDKYYDQSGKVMKRPSKDSVWNFHVWNEGWMARPELPHGYGGWQAFDATPQETSEGVYCCGPCPVRAIKEGKVKLPYDGPFIFAEVNADRVSWQVNEDRSKKIIDIERTSVGRHISTYSLRGSREDLTLEYKHRENTVAERVAVRRAQQLMSSSVLGHLDDNTPKEVNFELHFDDDGTFVGDAFVLKLQCHNGSSEARTLEGLLLVKTMYYTGVEADDVATKSFRDIKIDPGQSETLEVTVTEGDYLDKLKDMCMLSLTVMAKVKETGQIFSKTDDARLRKPHLQITGPSSVKVGDEMEVEMSFTNPLSTKLTDCFLEIEAPGFTKATRYRQSNLDGKETFTTTIKLKPTRETRRQREIVFIFNSDQLEDINGTHKVHVTN
ncbi:hypothetical protein ACOMHN_018029 [Nucella lapillus]